MMTLRRGFADGSKAQKVSMSENLREELSKTPPAEFLRLLKEYQRLTKEGIVLVVGRSYVITEQDWREKFDKATNVDQQTEIIDALNFVMGRGLNETAIKGRLIRANRSVLSS